MCNSCDSLFPVGDLVKMRRVREGISETGILDAFRARSAKTNSCSFLAHKP